MSSLPVAWANSPLMSQVSSYLFLGAAKQTRVVLTVHRAGT